MDVKERPIKADEIPQSSLSTLEISDTLLRDPPDLIGKPPTPLSTEGSSDQCKTSARDTDFGMPSRSVLSKPWRRCPAADDPVKPTSDPPTPITSKIDKSYAESSDANNARLPSPTPHMEASSIALASRLGSKSDSTGAPLPLLFRLQPPNVPAATSSLPAEHASLSERMSISKPEDVRTTAPAKALAERLRPGIAASQPMPSILAPVKAPLATRFGALSSLPNRPFGEGPNAAIPILEAGQPGWRNPLASESPELLPLVPLAQRMLPVASNVLGAAAVDAVTGVPALNSALNASRSASDNGHTVEDIVSGTELHNHRHISHSADKRVPGASLRPPFALAQHSISGTARPSIENATNLNADTSGLRFKEASGSIPAHLNVDFGSLPQTPSIPLGSFPLADGGETFLDDQTSATASTTDDDTDRQLHTDADLIPVSSGQILCADPSNELPPRAEMGRTPQNSTQVINPAKEVASLIIRLLLSELSRCSSSCLEGFEVAFAPGSLPLRSDIGHMIEVMGGLLLDIDSKGLQAPARASLQRYIVFPRGPRDIKGDPYDKHVDTIHLDVVEFLELLNGLRDPDTSTPLEFARFAARPSLFERLSKSD